MSEGGNDLSRIVSLIMQNPKLIEEISSLAKGTSAKSNEETDESSVSSENTEVAAVRESSDGDDTAVNATSILRREGSAARAQLLTALKPYVSRERAGAIDSMISIAEILDVMKAR